MWDHITPEVISFAHIPGGANILYFDGHVEFQRYPGLRFPVTKTSAAIMGRYGHLFDALVIPVRHNKENRNHPCTKESVLVYR